MAANTTQVTSSVITATSQHKRDFAEMFRRLNPEITRTLALVDGSELDPWGKPSYTGRGMIKKKAVKRMDPEWATSTPADVMFEATGGSSTTATVADTTYFQTGDKLCNTTTKEVSIVVTLTSSTTLTVTPVDGGTWSCADGEWIAMLSSTYEEGTSRYSTVTTELTTNKTYLETFREGIALSDIIKKSDEYTREKQADRYMTDKTFHALRKLESSFWYSRKATNGTTSATIASTAYSLYSMQGILQYAGSAIDMGGTFNWQNLNTVLYPQLPKVMKPNEVIYAAMSRKLAAVMNQWGSESYLTMGTNAGEKKFGKEIKTFLVGGNLQIEPIVMDIFDTGGMDDSIVFVQSSDLEYLYMDGMDINVRENAQLPATMGTVDIIEGTVGLRSWSNGSQIKWVKNCLAAG